MSKLVIINSILLIMVIASMTFLLRSLPFLIFNRRIPEYIKYLGSVLPYGIMSMLIVYSLKDTKFTSSPFGIAEFLSLIVVIILHKKFHNTLLSIFVGTLLYMILIQNFS